MNFEDFSLTRRCLKNVTSQFHVLFLFGISMLGGVLCVVGVILQVIAIAYNNGMTGNELAKVIDKNVPTPYLLIAIGVIDFSLFFPWFITFYNSRHLLISIERLEKENDALKKQITALGEREK